MLECPMQYSLSHERSRFLAKPERPNCWRVLIACHPSAWFVYDWIAPYQMIAGNDYHQRPNMFSSQVVFIAATCVNIFMKFRQKPTRPKPPLLCLLWMGLFWFGRLGLPRQRYGNWWQHCIQTALFQTTNNHACAFFESWIDDIDDDDLNWLFWCVYCQIPLASFMGRCIIGILLLH